MTESPENTPESVEKKRTSFLEIPVGFDDDGIRLDRWFKRHRPNITHALLQKWLRSGTVRLDGRKAEASDRVAPGQSIRLPATETPPPATSRPRDARAAERLYEMTLYEDANLIALNKPAGLAVQGGSKIGDSVDAMLMSLGEKAERPKLVHRLDKDTSGVLVVAKTAKAAAILSAAFAGHDLQKTYWALVRGIPRPGQGTIDLPLGKTSHGQSTYELVTAGRYADDREDSRKPAVTDYRVLERLGTKLAWVELLPRTGRTHQLRAHMLAINHPILGDPKYTGQNFEVFEGEGIADHLHLHARAIDLTGVFSNKRLVIEAPLSGPMKQTFETLGLAE